MNDCKCDIIQSVSRKGVLQIDSDWLDVLHIHTSADYMNILSSRKDALLICVGIVVSDDDLENYLRVTPVETQ